MSVDRITYYKDDYAFDELPSGLNPRELFTHKLTVLRSRTNPELLFTGQLKAGYGKHGCDTGNVREVVITTEEGATVSGAALSITRYIDPSAKHEGLQPLGYIHSAFTEPPWERRSLSRITRSLIALIAQALLAPSKQSPKNPALWGVIDGLNEASLASRALMVNPTTNDHFLTLFVPTKVKTPSKQEELRYHVWSYLNQPASRESQRLLLALHTNNTANKLLLEQF